MHLSFKFDGCHIIQGQKNLADGRSEFEKKAKKWIQSYGYNHIDTIICPCILHKTCLVCIMMADHQPSTKSRDSKLKSMLMSIPQCIILEFPDTLS